MNPNAPSWNPPPGMAQRVNGLSGLPNMPMPNMYMNTIPRNYNRNKMMEEANKGMVNNFNNMMREANAARKRNLVNTLSRKSRSRKNRSRKSRSRSRKSRSRSRKSRSRK